MKTISLISELRQYLNELRKKGNSIALVPTMGNLHEGHLRLVDFAKQKCDVVVVSIFVNPSQFGPNEDFAAYPRTMEQDRERLDSRGCDVLFYPDVKEIYPNGDSLTSIHVDRIGEEFCGASRPGHFDGVCLVVNKLFNIVQPDLAVFGEKDRQQLQVISAMVDDLMIPVQICSVETVRNSDGLALSSRNQYLSAKKLKKAALLHKTLINLSLRASKSSDVVKIIQQEIEVLEASGFKVDYLAFSDEYINEIQEFKVDCGFVLGAVYLGKTRLIDNVKFQIND
ncbi:MAG: pantoate--beta-alanine ligase [bacterium]